MSNHLKQFFPMIQESQEILHQIRENEHLSLVFDRWEPSYQQEFLDFCTGVRGGKVLYDSFFKEILNPETAPEYLEDFLSLLMKQKVKILYVLPNDSTRIADESSLLTTDIVVELENRSLVNVEIQKIGYKFPGERSACYSADLLLRQYKRTRSERKKKFNYKDIKTVYTIILFEHSPQEFHQYPTQYLHRFEQCSDTGLKLELLQKYLFIPLDIFRQNYHNKEVDNKLDAWLMFFSTDEPEQIIRLITAYPEFCPLYEKIYDICRNVEKVMGIFSKELLEMDRNTAQYMIDEMQEQIDRQKAELDAIEQKLCDSNQKLSESEQGWNETRQELTKALQRIKELENQLK